MERCRRSYRGISSRTALEYLEGLGGERVDDAAVEGDDWHASMNTETITIGPSLELTEVTVIFEGDSETLDSLIERFSRKALRAGG